MCQILLLCNVICTIGTEKTKNCKRPIFVAINGILPLFLKKHFENKCSVVGDMKRMKNVIMKKSYSTSDQTMCHGDRI